MSRNEHFESLKLHAMFYNTHILSGQQCNMCDNTVHTSVSHVSFITLT